MRCAGMGSVRGQRPDRCARRGGLLQVRQSGHLIEDDRVEQRTDEASLVAEVVLDGGHVLVAGLADIGKREAAEALLQYHLPRSGK